MKTYHVIENCVWKNEEGKEQSFEFSYRYLDRLFAEKACVRNEGARSRLSIVEREEDFVIFHDSNREYDMYIPPKIRNYETGEEYEVERGRNFIVKGINLSIAISSDIRSIERYCAYWRSMATDQDRFKGACKYLISFPILNSIRFFDKNKVQLFYIFTHHAYLSTREIEGNVCKIENDAYNCIPYLYPVHESFIGINIYW